MHTRSPAVNVSMANGSCAAGGRRSWRSGSNAAASAPQMNGFEVRERGRDDEEGVGGDWDAGDGEGGRWDSCAMRVKGGRAWLVDVATGLGGLERVGWGWRKGREGQRGRGDAQGSRRAGLPW